MDTMEEIIKRIDLGELESILRRMVNAFDKLKHIKFHSEEYESDFFAICSDAARIDNWIYFNVRAGNVFFEFKYESLSDLKYASKKMLDHILEQKIVLCEMARLLYE